MSPAPNLLNLEMIGGKSVKQKLWEAMRSLTTLVKAIKKDRKVRGFTLADLEDATRIHPKTISDYIQSLIRAGFVVVTDEGEKGRLVATRTYEVVNDIGMEAPRIDSSGKVLLHGTATEAMWGSLRRVMPVDFNYRELVALAATPSRQIPEQTAKNYVFSLHKAGYLECVKKAIKGKGILSRYRLIRNTGSKPPIVRHCDQIYDANLDQVVWEKITVKGDTDV